MMQSLGRRCVRHVNFVYRRSGTLWEGRYRAAPIDSEAYFVACCRTIELNPVRAGMVDHPRAYRWSSYRAHADGAADAVLTATMRSIGRSGAAARRAARPIARCSAACSTASSSRRCGRRLRRYSKRSKRPSRKTKSVSTIVWSPRCTVCCASARNWAMPAWLFDPVIIRMSRAGTATT
jgi:hypothetical protein